MKKILAFSLTLLTGCAAAPLFQALIGQRISVSVPAELPFPDAVTLSLGGQAGEAAKLGDALLGALGQEGLELKLGKALKKSASPLRRLAAQGFKDELVKAQLFGSVVESGGNVGMAVAVSRWGLAYDAKTKNYLPVLDLKASLSEPHIGVVWKASRSAAQLTALAKEQVGKIDITALIAKPQGYQDIMALVARDLSRQLVEDLRQNPPRVR